MLFTNNSEGSIQPMPYPPKVGIVILNFNGLKDTLSCLQSVSEIDYSPFEVILVDNGSREDPTIWVRNNFEKVIIIRNEQNFGFAEGSNIGIKKALELNCDLILLLNNDTIVDRNILTAFLKAKISKPEGGIFGGKIVRYDDPNIIDHIGGMWNRKMADFVSLGTNQPIDFPLHNMMKRVDYVCGCAMLITKEVIEKIGFLEKDFFLLWEETDFCYRAKKKDFEIWTVPKALIRHKVSASFTGGSIHSDYYWWRNRLLWIRRNLSTEEKIKIYFSVLIPNFYKLFKLIFFKSLEFHFLRLLKKSDLKEKKIVNLLRYKARFRGVMDYFFKNFGPGPVWINNPKNHKFYRSLSEISNK